MESQPPEGSAPLLQRLSPHLVLELRSYITKHSKEIEALIAQGGEDCGEFAGRKLAKVFDGLLGSLFYGLRAAFSRSGGWRPATLAAVGSYGRGAVALRSDLDVRFIYEGSVDGTQECIEAMLYPLWDAGLNVGHQVVTLDDLLELARKDLPTATSVLDLRTIAQDSVTEEGDLERVLDGLFGPPAIGDFLERLSTGTEERHDRYGGSVYLLEPDVKNGPGGLRDLDIAHWAARARWRVRNIRELVQLGVLVPQEWQQMAQANDFMWRVRNLLHLYSGRRLDRLSFDRQEQLSVDLGYGEGGSAVEHFMSDYYRQARAVARSREMILARAAPPPKKRQRSVSLGHGLKLTHGAMSLEDSSQLEEQPALAFRIYDEAVRRDLPIYPPARDALMRAAGSQTFCEKLRESEEAAKLFVKLVSVTARTPFKHASVVQELHDVGLLVAMVPEFAPVVGRVHHDVYHVFTVDAHSVAAVERLATLCRGELASDYPLASRLAAELARPTVLFFATLLHDVGKDIGGSAHSQRAYQLVPGILRRLCVSEADIVEVQHLVLEHLTMYHVATRRDLDDPHTLDFFCRRVRGQEGLRELYLLSVCDVSTTSPTAMTSWKARMLDELYVASDRVLSQGAESRDRERTESIRAVVRDQWQAEADRSGLEHFLAAMPERYFYANAPSAIRDHARFVLDAAPHSSLVRVLSEDDSYVEIGFIADDRPGLLALITATLAAARLPVLTAQILSWQGPDGTLRALDLFWVRTGARSAAMEDVRRRLDRDLGRLLRGELTPGELGGGLRPQSALPERPSPAVRTEIIIDNRAATEHTVVEVATRDRLGLLFGLARAIQQEGLTISLAKINTEGDRVADVFYVLDGDGGKLTTTERVDSLKKRILATILDLENGRNGS